MIISSTPRHIRQICLTVNPGQTFNSITVENAHVARQLRHIYRSLRKGGLTAMDAQFAMWDMLFTTSLATARTSIHFHSAAVSA